MAKKKKAKDEYEHYRLRVEPMVSTSPWVLRLTDHKNRPPPIMIIKQRCYPEDDEQEHSRPYLKQRGVLWGESQRRLLPILRMILARMLDGHDHPLELQQYLQGNRIEFRGNLPLDHEAGAKAALIFKLQERLKDGDRVELLARRVDRFTEEEASYWYSRTTNFGPDANRWAIAGMKIMLGGVSQDPAVEQMLERLRQMY